MERKDKECKVLSVMVKEFYSHANTMQDGIFSVTYMQIPLSISTTCLLGSEQLSKQTSCKFRLWQNMHRENNCDFLTSKQL